MFELKESREKCASLFKGMDSIIKKAEAENRDLTDSEVTSYQGLEVQYKNAIQQRDRLDRAPNAGEISARHRMESEFLKTVKPSVTLGQRIAQPQGQEWKSFDEFLSVAAFNPRDPRLDYQNYSDARAEQSMGSGSKGGFAVPAQFMFDFQRVEPGESIVLPRAKIIPPGTPPDAPLSLPALDQSGAAPHNMFGGIEVNWSSEGADKVDTDADIRLITWEPRELAAIMTTTEKLLRNAPQLGDIFGDLLRAADLAEKDRQFLLGNGVAKPLGYLVSDAAKTINRAVSGRIGLSDVLAMRSSLLMRRGAQPVWVASTDVRAELLALRNYSNDSPAVGDGSLLFQPSLREGESDRLLGLGVEWSAELPQQGSRGDLALCDFGTYIVKLGSGPFVDIGYVNDDFKKGKLRIRIVSNCDGRPWLTGPITMANGTTQSGCVVLDIPA